MPGSTGPDFAAQRSGPFSALLGWVVGTALQLQQAALWLVWGYLALAAAGALAAGWSWRYRFRDGHQGRRVLAWLLCATALGFAGTGLRSLVFDAQALDPALEGRDLRVVGVVTDMPQRNEAGLRFTLATDSATLDGRAVCVPSRMDVGWYSSGFGGGALAGGEPAGSERVPADVRAGERWSLTLRLKAPHGSRNPFGFDYELWLWERGVQATAYVREGSNDPPPQRLSQTWTHPVALLRQSVRERIFASVQQKQVAGLIAALVVGDQAAIDRWRITNKS